MNCASLRPVKIYHCSVSTFVKVSLQPLPCDGLECVSLQERLGDRFSASDENDPDACVSVSRATAVAKEERYFQSTQ